MSPCSDLGRNSRRIGIYTLSSMTPTRNFLRKRMSNPFSRGSLVSRPFAVLQHRSAFSRSLFPTTKALSPTMGSYVLAATSPVFFNHDALLLTQSASEAWIAVSTLLGVAASVGVLTYLVVRTAWEKLEPLIVQNSESSSSDESSLVLYGIDCTYSRLLKRPEVLKAVDFAAEAHAGQYRRTGEPYVAHCIETALIMEGLLSPSEDDHRAETAVIAALLHDVLDDTSVDVTEMEEEFGEVVCSLVAKVSQLSATNQLVRRRLRLSESSPTIEEENLLREMILTMVGEPLAILIKLADRLHNMRTVYVLGPEKRRAVAEETQRVWCSLAERLGMFAVKSELEDLCFAVLQPYEYRQLRAELDELWGLQSIPESAVTPSDCCLTGECECEFGAQEEEDATGQGAGVQWLGSAHAPLPMHDAALPEREEGNEEEEEEEDGDEKLDADQRQLKKLIDSVLPFDASTFDIDTLKAPPGVRRGLEVLQGCARCLLQEITTEGCALGLEVFVAGRVKSLYSVFKKMARKSIPLSQVYDARALRVVVDDDNGRREREAIAACYRLKPAVHRLWRKVGGEEDDYIAQPKESGYRSLHTAVMGPGGVPMEVQIRTTSMHEEAEYGRAAHWAYKEQPLAGVGGGGGPVGPDAIGPGHPILQINGTGQLRDGVVVRSDHGGLRLLVAINMAVRMYEGRGATRASVAEYERLQKYVDEEGYWGPGQGDSTVNLELYTLCSDGKYHRLDHCGHKMETVAVPLHRWTESIISSSDEDDDLERDEQSIESRTRLLRSMLEWSGEVRRGRSGMSTSVSEAEEEEENVESSFHSVSEDVMVLVWPGGKILRLPRGTTAGDAVKRLKPDGGGYRRRGNHREDEKVNVNNRFVPKETALADGDYLVLSKDKVEV